jgi:hypothetical protein
MTASAGVAAKASETAVRLPAGLQASAHIATDGITTTHRLF